MAELSEIRWHGSGGQGVVTAGKLLVETALHGNPYVPQAAPRRWRDLMTKTRKAVGCSDPAFMNVLASCNRGWRHGTDETVEITQLAVDTWPGTVAQVVRRSVGGLPPTTNVVDWLYRDCRMGPLLKRSISISLKCCVFTMTARQHCVILGARTMR